ncbi:MAG: pirin family protein [Leptospiraceae bacterium]|nr:pirin family protein [Leptospiraceae bacterium]MCP5502571.1 pirin family protein [Leptospiraceae bacterium]
MQEREITKIVTAHRQIEGGGFVVRRPFPTIELDNYDPFLLLDEMGPVDYPPGKAVGAPDHPHRGFETVTYLLEGEMVHEDSFGHKGFLRPGAVQWMTAGSGLIHSELPSEKMLQEGGLMHGFQLWLNLPAKDKMRKPRYQELEPSQIPEVYFEKEKCRIRVIAGEVPGAKAGIETCIPIEYYDISIEEGGEYSFPLSETSHVFLYVFFGSLIAGKNRIRLQDGQLGIPIRGDGLRIEGSKGGGRCLLIAGEPIREPVARYGPFVMNTREEIMQAFSDYEQGKMGKIHR